MGHRDRTFVSYAAEDASAWWEMRAWPQEQRIPFDFEDAYDLHAKGDTNRAVPALAACQGTQAFADIRHRRRGATTD